MTPPTPREVSWHVDPDPRGGYIVYVYGHEPYRAFDATTASLIVQALTRREPIDVERLARAMRLEAFHVALRASEEEAADVAAAEYARLAEADR